MRHQITTNNVESLDYMTRKINIFYILVPTLMEYDAM
jgi:hypothetical protein